MKTNNNKNYIKSVQCYPSHVEVYTMKGVTSFSYEEFDNEHEAFEAWTCWCDEQANIAPLSRQNFDPEIKNYLSRLFSILKKYHF